MSYTNQLDHQLLDRMLLREFLIRLATATVQTSPVATSRAEHIALLKARCDSDFEREWLDYLESHNLRLPDAAQHLIEECNTLPDFVYTEHVVAIYIDGIHHTYENIMAHDRQVTAALENAGYTVIRFGDRVTWREIVQRNAWLFGAIE